MSELFSRDTPCLAETYIAWRNRVRGNSGFDQSIGFQVARARGEWGAIGEALWELSVMFELSPAWDKHTRLAKDWGYAQIFRTDAWARQAVRDGLGVAMWGANLYGTGLSSRWCNGEATRRHFMAVRNHVQRLAAWHIDGFAASFALGLKAERTNPY